MPEPCPPRSYTLIDVTDNEKAVTVVNAGIGEPYGAFGLNNRMGESRLASLQEDM